jgi:hypothetical protein
VGDLSRPDQESSRGTMDVIGSAWRTSSYSGSNGGGACIEIGTAGPVVVVRDSKDQNGPQFAFPASTWQTFTNQLKASA